MSEKTNKKHEKGTSVGGRPFCSVPVDQKSLHCKVRRKRFRRRTDNPRNRGRAGNQFELSLEFLKTHLLVLCNNPLTVSVKKSIEV